MGDHGSIADAGKTLVELLRDRMTETGPLSTNEIVLASPVDDDLANIVRLTVFLFDVEGSTPMDGARRNDGLDEPLRLDLKYLLTAHPGKENSDTSTTARTASEHRVLGRAMQVLRDNAIIEGPDLRGSLSPDDDGGDNERLEVSLLAEPTDSLVNLWNTFGNEPYRPSVAFLVTPVEIESRRETPVERVEHVRFEEHVPGGNDE